MNDLIFNFVQKSYKRPLSPKRLRYLRCKFKRGNCNDELVKFYREIKLNNFPRLFFLKREESARKRERQGERRER